MFLTQSTLSCAASYFTIPINARTYHRTYHQVPQFRPKQAFAMFERMINDLPFDQDTATPLIGTHEEL
jgi:hypothetical protein